ncbi:phage tail protein [Pseudomonas sp. TTU2014-080ASC]|uniref:phage tail protein n=1 Tax=Pseudomonas sp. TTU2014-080ASC TaxID=1729724 RepID=UPI000718767C|nr:phage tail protein [Pseudomonas sp. TTU2014-080ASC]KRW62333.1 phage tail protein [Pseudomonas sp. TTU2014-080ASC]
MAIETFTWAADDEAQLDGAFKVRSAQFGDGYQQVVGDGLNNESRPWALTFGGSKDEIAPILAFVRRHGGFRSFLWSTPEGVLGMYRCPTYRLQAKPNGLQVLSLNFTQAFKP